MKNTFQLLLTYKLGATTGTTDVSENNCANWDDVTLAYKRADYDGVIRAFSTSFEFVKDAYDVILMCANQYGGWEMDGYQASWQDGNYCRVELRHLQEDWTYPATADYTCDLDFSTLKLTRGKASISAFDQSLTAKVKDMGGDKFTFSAQETDIPFCYLGIHKYLRWYCKFAALNSSNILTYMVDGSNWEEFQYSRGYGDKYFKGVYMNSGTGRKPPLAWRRVYGWIGTDTTKYATLQANAPAAEIHYRIVVTLSYTYNADIPLRLYGVRNSTTYTLANAVVKKSDTDSGKRYVSYEINWYGYWGSGITNGVRTSDVFRVQLDTISGVSDAALVLNNGNGVEYDAEWYITTPSIGQSTAYDVPAFSVSRLLDAIGYEITGRSNLILGSDSAITIESGNDYIDKCAIFSTGYLHNDGGKFECSYNDVKEWLQVVFNYVPTYDETNNRIVFKQRTSQFDTDITNATIFAADECNDVTATMKANMMYGRVTAGYDKQEYDVAEYTDNEYNGGAITWKTGASSDRELKLVSSFRADTMGIETALDDFDAEDLDSGDIWFVYCKSVTYNDDEEANPLPAGTWKIPDTIYYEADQSGDDAFMLTGVTTNAAATMINRCYNPRMILAVHGFQVLPSVQKPYAATLTYVSTQAANTGIAFGNPNDGEDVLQASGYAFTTSEFVAAPRPMEVTFTAAETPQPSNWDYLVEIHANGMVYTGWVLDAKFHILHSKEAQYTILANTIKQE